VEQLLEIRNLVVSFPVHDGQGVTNTPAVRDVNLHISKGEVLGLVGESGSGKSVTSLAIMRLLPPTAAIHGAMHFEGNELTRLADEQMRTLRGKSMAMIFQEPMTALNPVMRVGDQVAEAVLAHGSNGHRASKSEAWQKAVEALTTVAIPEPDRRARDYPHQLSGGQRQRVMIAMAIVNRPQLLIADEPTTALDVTVQAQILDLLTELRHKFGLAMLFISHDLAVVSQVSDRVAVMYAGQIVETGPARTLFQSPLHPYTRGLMNSVPTLRTERSQPLQTIEGTVPAISSLPPGCSFEPRCDLRISSCSQIAPPLKEVEPGHFVRCPVVTKH
jgi:oligopeptide/dipeptide ABC transporter ATP-binding protein